VFRISSADVVYNSQRAQQSSSTLPGAIMNDAFPRYVRSLELSIFILTYFLVHATLTHIFYILGILPSVPNILTPRPSNICNPIGISGTQDIPGIYCLILLACPWTLLTHHTWIDWLCRLIRSPGHINTDIRRILILCGTNPQKPRTTPFTSHALTISAGHVPFHHSTIKS
jgi:hypothetical protein